MIFLKTVINKTALGLYHDNSPFKSPFNTATLLIQSVFCGSLVTTLSASTVSNNW